MGYPVQWGSHEISFVVVVSEMSNPGYSGASAGLGICQRLSAPVRRQSAMAHAQGTMNRPATVKPTLLRLNALTQVVTGLIQPRLSCSTLTNSMVPMSSATATDEPVMVRL